MKINLNNEVKKYNDLKEQLKALKKEQDAIALILKQEASKRNNAFTTKEFNVILQITESRRLCGLKDAVQLLGAETVEPLINISEVKKLVVNKK